MPAHLLHTAHGANDLCWEQSGDPRELAALPLVEAFRLRIEGDLDNGPEPYCAEAAHHRGPGHTRNGKHRITGLSVGRDLFTGCPAQSQRPVGVCLEPGPVLFPNGGHRGKELPLPLALRFKDGGFLGRLRGLLIGPKRIMSIVHVDSMNPAARVRRRPGFCLRWASDSRAHSTERVEPRATAVNIASHTAL